MDGSRLRVFVVAALAMFVGVAKAQPWASAYEEGLTAAAAKNWPGAREAFKKAVGYRPEDVAEATNLPGPAGEQRRWRDGSPYSPNFLAAYSSYRLGLAEIDPAKKTEAWNTASAEFETLIAKGQESKETFYFLNQIYMTSGNVTARQALQTKLQGAKNLGFKVDTTPVLPEDLAALRAAVPAGTPRVVNAGDPSLNQQPNQNQGSIANPAPMAATFPKYALIIGNSESKLADGKVPFASDDAQLVRDGLIAGAGYVEGNIEVVINGTAQQIIASASALAGRIEEGASVVIYFTGTGLNLEGKDYLAGVDTELPNDTSSMVAKGELFRLFMAKGARIFSFWQVSRTIRDGRYFGQEVPFVGSIAQVQSTKPGDVIYSTTRGGKTVGLFSSAFVSTLADLNSTAVPIMEFGWQLFYKMRKGDTGTTGGASRQVPTLPVLTNLASDSRF